jgi:uncharacterized repeat protein (TIGR03803 family)
VKLVFSNLNGSFQDEIAEIKDRIRPTEWPGLMRKGRILNPDPENSLSMKPPFLSTWTLHRSRPVCLLLLGIIAFSVEAREVVSLFDASLDSPAPSETVVYKTIDGQELKAHIHHPEKKISDPGPGILWFHGGGWESGSPEYLHPHAAYFARLGYLSVNVEYRLAGAGNTLFDCLEDARDAFYWMVENADTLGLAPDKIIVAGESAGGHLAASVGMIPDSRSSGIPDPQPVPKAIVLLNAITDLTSIPWAMQKPGLTPDDEALGQSISPQYHLDAADPPVLLLHGKMDGVVPPSQSSDFAEGLHARGVPAKLRLWDETDHAFFLFLEGSAAEEKTVIQKSLLEIEAFLQYLGINGYPAVHGHFSPLHLFAGSDGFRSFSELVSVGEWLYGSTYSGGTNGNGLLFRIHPETLDYDVLHEFSGTDGREPFNGLALDGTTLYGVCKFGGSEGQGTLWSIETDGSGFQILHHFDQETTGFYPHAAPVLVNGRLYGGTYHGGTSLYAGILYQFTLPSGPIEVIHNFEAAIGRHPTGELTPVGDWLYGTASDLFQHDGGHHGSLYRIHSTTHQFQLLHTFNGTSDGGHPYDALYHDGGDLLFGTAFGRAFQPASKGTLYKYSISNDTFTVIHDFADHPGTGSKPNGSFIRVEGDEMLYAVAHGSNGEGGGLGTLFRVHPDGSRFDVLHVFTSGLSGNIPMRSLVYHRGAFYGISVYGGLTTDTSNPETGGGFIFRYRPEPIASGERKDYIDWLSGHVIPLNSDLNLDFDFDTFSLIEEYVYGFHPFQSDAVSPMSLQPGLSNSPVLRFPRVRSSASDFLVPWKSTDLDTWEPADGFTVETQPTEVEGFVSLKMDWTSEEIGATPIFRRIEFRLPE